MSQSEQIPYHTIYPADVPLGDTRKGRKAWQIMADDDDDDVTFQIGAAFDVKVRALHACTCVRACVRACV